MPGIRVTVIIALFVVLALLRSEWGTRLDGFTPDEPYHVVAGVSYVETGDFRLNPEHPPLVKLVAGMGARGALRFPGFEPLESKLAERDFTERVTFADSDAEAVQSKSRWAMFVLNGLLLAVLGGLLWLAFGPAWALLTLCWLALEPTVSAHMPVVMTDLPLMLSLGIMALAAAAWARSDEWRWTIAFGLSLGLALGSKHSALPGVLAVGIACVLVALWPLLRRRWRSATRAFGQLVIALLIGVCVLWAQYGFRYHASPEGDDPFNKPLAAKIDELNVRALPDVLRRIDQWHLLPRSYTWGLADTLRAGVEGRGQNEHYLYGHTYEGAPPWYFWFGILSAKVPIALLIMALVGVATLLRARLGAGARYALLMITVVAFGHWLALLSSNATYAGMRHALPLLLPLAVAAGAVSHWLQSGRPMIVRLAPLVLVLAALLETVAEPRLWEYHNALAGGTAKAADGFGNEGVMLGQRLPEIVRWYRANLPGDQRPVYPMSWFVEEEAQALDFPLKRYVESIYDDNYEGVFEGLFLVEAGSFRPWPNWDPSLLDGLTELTRLGNIHVMQGRIASPRFRNRALRQAIDEHLDAAEQPDWAVIAQRCREMTDAAPWVASSWFLLANASLRLDRRDEALTAYRKVVENSSESDPFMRRVHEQIARIETGAPLSSIAPLPNPYRE